MTQFIRNLSSKERYDRIRINVLVDRIEKQAHMGCGLHYEIYNRRVMSALMDYLSDLSEGDAAKLIKFAETKGYNLDEESLHQAIDAERELMREIEQEY